MQKNFTNLLARAINARLQLNATVGLLLLFLLMGNVAAAQTISGISPSCATVGQDYTVTISGSGFSSSGANSARIILDANTNSLIVPTSILRETIEVTIPGTRINTTGNHTLRIRQTSGNTVQLSNIVSFIVIGAPTATGGQRCGTGTVTLNATGGAPTGGNYRWYTEASGGSSLFQGTAYTTASISTTTTYYVASVTASGCESLRTAVTATINPLPDAPTVAGTPEVICVSGTTVLTVSGAPSGGRYQWYTSASGATAIAGATSSSFTTPEISTSTTYYVSAISAAGCESSTRTAVRATVIPLISPFIGGVSAVCANQTQVNFSTNTSASGFLWAIDSGDATITSGGNTSSVRITIGGTPGTVTVSLIAYNDCGAPGPAATKTFTVNPSPTAVITAPEGAVACVSTTLVAEPVEGATYQWYRGSTAVTAITSSNTYDATTSFDYHVVVRYSGTTECAATSNTIGVTINPLPTATITQGATATYCADGSTTLTAQESGTGYTYQWYLNGSPIGDETARSLTVSAEGDYTVEVFRNGCSTISEPTTVTELPLPTAQIITPVSEREACAGSSVVLTAEAGTGYSYRWFAEGNNTVLDSDASFETFTPGNYFVEVTGSNGCTATSASVAVIVNQPPVATITVTGPTDFCFGESLTLYAPLAPVGSTYSYEWNLDGGTTVIGTDRSLEATSPGTYTVTVINTTTGCRSTSAGTVVREGTLELAIFTYTGATEFCAPGSLQLDAILPPENQNYTYRWFNAAGTTVSVERSFSATVTGTYQVEITETLTGQNCVRTSVPIEVTVNPQPTADITGGAQSLCAEADNTTTFSVSGTFSGGSAEWSSSNTNFVIEDAVYDTETGVATATVVATGSGDATISLTTSSTVEGCNEAADAVVLNVRLLPIATITPQGETTFCQGDEVILVASEGEGYTYQWYLNGEPVIGTGSSYTASLSGNYYVVVTSNSCPVQSPAVAVTVNPLPTATIEAEGDLAFCEGSSVVLNAVSDIGTDFIWYRNGTEVGTGATYTATESGSYTLGASVDGTGCSNLSAATVVNVNATPDATITALGATTFCDRESVTLQAPEAPNGQTYSYQWFNGSAQVGTNQRTYQAAESGSYTVRVTNTSTALNCSATTATPVAVTVNPLPVASISYPDTAPTTFCQGGSLLLTGVSSTGPSSYIWYRNNEPIIGATGATYTATQTGSYTVRATDGNTCTGDMSVAVQVTVQPTITGNTIVGTQTVCSGAPIAALGQSSTATLGGGATPYGFQWQISTNNSTWNNITTGGNAASYTPPVQTVTASTTTYYRRIVSGGGCSSTSASVAVTVKPLPTVNFTGIEDGATIFSGQGNITLTGSPSGGTWSWPGGTSRTFSPCTAFSTAAPAGATQVTVPITYTVTSGGCQNSITKNVNIRQSIYRAVVTSNNKPFCQGDNVIHTVRVYRDVEVVYPYLTNAAGDPVRDLATMTPIGPQETPVTNYAYPFPPNTPQIIQDYAWRYFNPIVTIGAGQEITSGYEIQWTKNQETEIGDDRQTFENAGLSSLDYYAAYITLSGGGACGPNFNKRISSRTYTAEQANYNITLSASPNPVCQGAPVTLTATLNGNFPWSTTNLVLNWMVDGVVIGTTNYTRDGAAALTFTATDLEDGDEISIDFNTDIEDFDKVSKCRERSNSNTIEIEVNDIITVADPEDQSATVCLNSEASFTAPITTTGTAPVEYIWTVNGVTYPASSSSTFTAGSDITGAVGVYPVSVVVSSECETTDAIEVGTLTVRDIEVFALSGGGSYCAYTSPVSYPFELDGSEIGVNYSLVLGTATEPVQTLEGTGGPLVFASQSTPGTYTVVANYAAEPSCAKTMGGSATITATTDTAPAFGDLTVTWINNMTQWEVVASEHSELYGPNPIVRWYTKTTGQTDADWVYNGFSSTTTWIVDNPTMDLEIKAEVFTTDETCQAFILTNIGVTPLPVEIIYLNAVKQGNNVVLEWATAMEEDNKGFEVQVSTDGFNYRMLTFVPAKNGNSSTKQEYEFTDKENGKFGTRYYRLKQIDTNGTFEFFGPKAVTFGSVASKVIAFPNPFHDEVTLDIAAEVDGEALITVTDAVGKQLLVRKVQVQKGFTTEKLHLDANLPRGLYIIKAQVGGITQYIKMIKE